MKSQLFIPDKIKVGYQHRNDTYTKKLAYVIYYDKKGVLRKEQSWKGWIHDKDQKDVWQGYELNEDGSTNYQKQIRKTLKAIKPDDFDNVPTEGFVLNKGAGGHAGSSSSWNIRRETIRIYDPRDFEFEISVANLLFILENTNSFKGKGLEGKFIYAWEGKDLVLLPENCQEYKDSMVFTSLKTKSVSIKTLIPGGIYLTKSQEKWIYLGKLDYFEFTHPSTGRGKYSYDSSVKEQKVTQYHIFIDKKGNYKTETGGSKLAEIVNDIPIDNYAELAENYYKSKYGSPLASIEFISKPIDIDKIRENSYAESYLYYDKKSDTYKGVDLYARSQGSHVFINEEKTKTEYRSVFRGFEIHDRYTINFKNNKFNYTEEPWTGRDKYKIENKRIGNNWTNIFPKYETKEDLEVLATGDLFVILESGTRVSYNNY